LDYTRDETVTANRVASISKEQTLPLIAYRPPVGAAS
jgi:hypothetical protein